MNLVAWKFNGKAFALGYGQTVPELQDRDVKANSLSALTPRDSRSVPKMGCRQAVAAFILALFSAFASPSLGAVVPVHVGGPSLAIQGQNPIVIPLFFANFSNTEVNQVDFSLNYDSTKLTFQSTQSLVDEAFTFKLSDTTVAGRRSFTFTAKDAGQGYGQFALMKVTLIPKSQNWPSTVQINQGVVNGNAAQTMTNTTLNLTTGNSSRADVDGNGQIDLADIDAAFDHVLQTQFLDRLDSKYDFSGKKPVGAFDIAQLQRHILGLNPVLPPVTNDTTVPSRINVNLTLSAPVSLGNNFYRYDISGRGVKGLLAGEVALNIEPSVFQSLSRVESPFGFYTNGVMGVETVTRSTQVHAYFASADSLALDGMLLQITVKHQVGKTASAFKGLTSAYLNEGTMAGNFTSLANGYSDNHATPIQISLRPIAAVSVWLHPYNFAIPLSHESQTLEWFDVKGQSLYRLRLIPGMTVLNAPSVPNAHILRLHNRQGMTLRSWVLPRRQ